MNVNTEEILNVASIVIAVSSVIVSLLPKPEPDSKLSKLYSLIDILALNIGKKKSK